MVNDRQALTIRLTTERYEWLRIEAFQRRIPMQQIVDEALDAMRNDLSPPDETAQAQARLLANRDVVEQIERTVADPSTRVRRDRPKRKEE